MKSDEQLGSSEPFQGGGEGEVALARPDVHLMVVKRTARYEVLPFARPPSVAPIDSVSQALVLVKSSVQLRLSRCQPPRLVNRVQRKAVKVDHLEPAVHAGDEEAVLQRGVPLEAPDTAACVILCQWYEGLTPVEETDLRVVAARA